MCSVHADEERMSARAVALIARKRIARLGMFGTVRKMPSLPMHDNFQVAFSARARTRGFGSELIFDLGRGRAVAEQVLLGQLAAGGRHRGG